MLYKSTHRLQQVGLCELFRIKSLRRVKYEVLVGEAFTVLRRLNTLKCRVNSPYE